MRRGTLLRTVLAVGREEQMIELKREVNEVTHKAGLAPPYARPLSRPNKEG